MVEFTHPLPPSSHYTQVTQKSADTAINFIYIFHKVVVKENHANPIIILEYFKT